MQFRRSAIDVTGRSGPRFSRVHQDAPYAVAWLALTLCAALLPGVGQAQTVEWAHSAGGTGNDGGRGIAVDAAGNSYVTGRFGGTATFGSFTVTSAGEDDIFVAKYDANGNALWVRSAGGIQGASERELGGAIAVDAAGNSYVTGRYLGMATFGAFTLTSTPGGWEDIFLAKYDAGGTVVWARTAGGPLRDEATSIAVDAAGNSYVTGRYLGTATFGAFTLTSTPGGWEDIFLAKYDAGGNILWVQSAGGTTNDGGIGIAVDAAGNSYVTGFVRRAATFGPFTLPHAQGTGMFIAKYDGSGNVLWVQSASGASVDFGTAIAVDTAGNSYVTGRFASDTVTFGPFTLTGAGGVADIFVAKYDGDGDILWAQSAGGSSDDQGFGIAVDDAGNSYVTGRFGETATFGSVMLTSASSGFLDIFVAKYDGGGNVLWAQSAGGTSHEMGRGIAVDAGGNSYVTGQHQGTATFGPFTLTSDGGFDVFVAKYAAPGITAVPAVSQWGLVVIALVLLTVARIVYTKFRMPAT